MHQITRADVVLVHWCCRNRYNLTDCEFYDNKAGSGGGGAVYIMVDQDTADEDDGGILKLTR